MENVLFWFSDGTTKHMSVNRHMVEMSAGRVSFLGRVIGVARTMVRPPPVMTKGLP
ncbi:hypothetical protein GCM10011408_09130 [Dyella caseinilytica]|nr:hypothetical protein GCM10011408_09130 [Dyella caseinilytica]